MLLFKSDFRVLGVYAMDDRRDYYSKIVAIFLQICEFVEYSRLYT